MALEPRILYDGAAAATAHDHHAAAADSSGAGASAAASPLAPAAPAGGHPNSSASQSGTPQSASPPAGAAEPFVEAIGTGRTAHEIVIIDGSVPDLNDLVAGVKPGDQVYLLDSSRDGLQQIADIIEANNLQDLSAIHIVSHGGEGQIRLGSTVLTDANLASNAQLLAEIGASLGANGDILLYGCDVGAGAAGQQFIADLAARTGADVAASTDRVGSAALGGDWTLEAATGAIEASLPFSEAALANYDGLLVPTLSATQTTTLFTDLDGDGVVDPGETVTTSVLIENTGTDAATGVSFMETLSRLTQVPGSVTITPIAFDDAYSLTGNTPLTINGANGLLANDIDPDASTPLSNVGLTAIGLFTDANTHGNVVLNADGSFTYTPEAGYTGTATFQYTAHDAQNLNSNITGTVTMTVTGLVWYVDSTYAGANGLSDGTYNRPYTSLLPLNGGADPDGPGDTIFVYDRGTAYTGGITLENSQTFLGDGAALTVNGLSIGASAGNTSLTNVGGTIITLGQNDTVRGFTLGNATTAIAGNNFGTLTIDTVTINSNGQALNLSNGSFAAGAAFTSITSTGGTHNIALSSVSGSVDLGSGALSGATGSAFQVGDGAGTANTGGTVAITYAGSIASGTGRAIDIQDRAASAGNISLSGNIAHSVAGQTGIFLDDNAAGTIIFSGVTKTISSGTANAVSLTDNAAGTTIDFTDNGSGNGLDITTTTGIAFLASGGGTLHVRGTGNSIATGTGTALNLSGVTVGSGGVRFESVSTVGAATGITLSNVSQAAGSSGIDIMGGSIASAATRGVDIDAVAADVAIAATISTSGSGRSVEVTNSGSTAVGGNQIVFSGAITDSGSGINLDNNDANNDATITFSGGLNIDSTTNIGFNAINGGTVNVTGANNSINTTTATALRVVDTTIGASDLTFHDISSIGGSATGIILDNTGTLGGLHVTGGGTAGSGGTIANKTGADGSTTTGIGIYLNNTSDVQLNRMLLHDFENFGIRGFGVNGFILANSTVDSTASATSKNGTSDAANEGSVKFGTDVPASNGLIGTASITNSVIADGFENNFEVYNQSGSLNLTVTGSTFRDTSTVGPGNAGMRLQADGSANMTALITTSSFINNRARGIQVINQGSGTVDVDIGQSGVAGSGGTFTNNFIAVDIAENGSGPTNFNVLNASFTTAGYTATFGGGGAGSPINIFMGGAASPVERGAFTGNIIGNTINNSDSQTGPGINVNATGTDNTGGNILTIKIDDNDVSGVANYGIIVQSGDGNATINATITNNTVTTTTNAGLEAIRVDAGATSSQAGAPGTPDNGTINLDIRGNDATASVAGGTNDIRLRQSFNTTFRLEDYLGSPTNPSAVQTYVSGNNLGASVLADRQLGGTPTFGTIADVPEPPAPLLVAPGGVQAEPAPGDTGSAPETPDPSADDAPEQGNSDTPDQTAGGTPAPTGPPSVFVDDGILSAAELDAIVDAAIVRWAATGLSAEQVAYLQNVTFTLTDMSGWYLGSAQGSEIKIDLDAAGHGWFVDATPFDDAEFSNNVNGSLFTNPNEAPAGHIDLLTTVMHELGHTLGLADTYSLSARASLMYGYIVDGERRRPVEGQADGAVLGSIVSEAFAIGPVALGTLPAGKSVTVSWQATVDLQSNGLIVNPSNQGTVSGTNFAPVNTNTDVVVLDTLTLGNRIFHDQNGNATFDGADVGINGVALTLFADNGTTAGVFDSGDTLITTATTAGGGLYQFAGLAPGEYIVRVDAGNFTGPGALATFSNTSPGTAPDPDNNVDNDNNGGPLTGGIVVTAPITLAYNGETTADGTGKLDINNTLDIGFIINTPPTATNLTQTKTYTEGASGVALDDIVVTDVDAGDTITATLTLAAPATGVLTTSGTATYTAGTGVWTITGTVAEVNAALAAVSFVPAADNDVDTTITTHIQDTAGTGPANGTIVLDVTPVNDAPVLDSNQTPALSAVNEDAAAPAGAVGTAVSQLVDLNPPPGGGLDNVSDVDTGPVTGIALTAVDASQGTWFYSTDNGANWAAVGIVSDAQALLLDAATSRLYFQPNADFNGTVTGAITFRAWDQSNGGALAGTKVDTSTNGDATPYSSATDTANVTVAAVDDIVADVLTTTEDTAQTINVLANDNFEGSATVTSVTQGANGTVTFLANGDVTYTPNADFNGTDSFTYTVTSGGVTENATVNVTVNADADIVADVLTTTEDTAQTINVLANDNFEGSATVTSVTQGANGTVTFLANGDVTYTPNADFNGTDSFTYTVTSGGVTENATVNVTVNADADIVADVLTTTEDTAQTINVLANDNFEGSATVTSVTQGANGTVTFLANGDVTYTPNADFNGTDSFTYTVTSGGVTENATVNVTVNADADIVADVLTTTEDTAQTINVLANDNFEGSATVTSVTQGANGTVTFLANGDVTYTPNADFNGTDSFTYTVTSGGVTENATVNVTVNADADIVADVLTTTEDTAQTINVLANDNFEGSATVTSVTQGANGTVTFLANGDVTYTPNADFNGTDSFTYTVTSGGVTENATVNVTVNADADIVADVLTTTEDTAQTINVLANDNFEGSATVTSVTQGANGTVTFLANGDVTYTPNADFNGTDSFTYTVTSGGVTENATVNVTVNADADIVADVLTTTEDTAQTINVLANDNFEGSATVTSVTQGANGTVTFLANGDVTYTPNADFNGTDSFTYTVTSGGVTENATVNVTVNADADIVADVLTTTEDTAQTINVLANDNFEGSATVTSVTQGANGTVTFLANGDVTYTPNADFNGTDSFTYTVTSGGVTENATVNVTVNADADIVADVLTTTEDTAQTINVLANDNFEGSATVTSVTQGANGTVTFLANGDVTYTPAANFNGTDSFTYTVTSGGVTETATVNVTINAVNDAPVVASSNIIFYDAERRQDKVLNPNITISDVDSATLSGARIAIAAGLTSDDRLRFTNQNGITGSYNSATGVLTLTGVASVADYQAALRSVTFFTDTRRDGIRFVTWTVNDGAAANNLSAARNTTILVDGINIRPPHHGDHHHHHHGHGHHHGHHDSGFGNRLVTVVGDAGFSFENRGRAVHYVHSEIEAISVADALQLKVPFDSLVAPLGGDVVSVTATLLDGSPLPPWLTFDAKTGLLAGALPAGVLASIRDVPGEAPGDVTGSLSADPRAILGTQPATRNGPINIEVVMRDTRGNISVMVFSIDLKVAPAINPVSHDGRQSWYLPLDDRPALHEMPWTAVPGAVSGTLAGDDLAADDAPVGRAGLSAQLATHGWLGMDAERAALLGSLQATAGWR